MTETATEQKTGVFTVTLPPLPDDAMEIVGDSVSQRLDYEIARAIRLAVNDGREYVVKVGPQQQRPAHSPFWPGQIEFYRQVTIVLARVDDAELGEFVQGQGLPTSLRDHVPVRVQKIPIPWQLWTDGPQFPDPSVTMEFKRRHVYWGDDDIDVWERIS